GGRRCRGPLLRRVREGVAGRGLGLRLAVRLREARLPLLELAAAQPRVSRRDPERVEASHRARERETMSVLLALILALSPVEGLLQDPAIKDAYAKQEVQIAMRDGKKLFTSIYAPKDASHPWPILLNRTPY